MPDGDIKPNGAAVPLPAIEPAQIPDHVTIKLGGESYDVGPLNWANLKHLRHILLDDADWTKIPYYQVVDNVIQVFAEALGKSTEEIDKKLRFDETGDLIRQYNVLLAISGFAPVGEAQATGQDGIGTLTASSPNAPAEEFTEETGSESNVA